MNMIKWLVENGADINDRNYNGTTVSMYLKEFVASSRNFDLLVELSDLGADFSLCDNHGLTLLDYVVMSGDDELANFIKRKKR